MPQSRDLERGRAAYAERRWLEARDRLAEADRSRPLDCADLERLGWSYVLLGQHDHYFATFERLHTQHLDAGDLCGAARAAFWLGFRLYQLGEVGRGTGWLATSHRLVERVGKDCVEQGYLLLPVALASVAKKDFAAARDVAHRATEIGERFADPNVTSLARAIEGQSQIELGNRDAGLALLDEAILPASTGRLDPAPTGIVYCAVIACCQRVFAIDRAREWSAALAEWCDSQPDLVEFNSLCRVYRAEILQTQGEWRTAMEEIRRANRPGALPNEAAAVCYQRGELMRLRGDFDLAEESYRDASKHGREPQPGLALLRLAQGKSEAAASAIRQVLAATRDPNARIRYLPAAVEILIAAGDLEGADAAARELADAAALSPTAILDAIAAHAFGAVALAKGDATAALGPLRAAFATWHEVGAPYIAARIRVLISRALQAFGDEEGAELERNAAYSVFAELGAGPDLSKLGAPEHTTPGETDRFGLTLRELQVLRMVASGSTNAVIAQQLSLSVKTVDRHVSNIFVKLDVPTRAAATAFAYQHRLV